MLLRIKLQVSLLALIPCVIASGIGLTTQFTLATQFAWAEDKPSAEKSPETLFQDLDKNKDGRLTSDEVSAEQRKFFDHLVRIGDADKNGELTRDEFLKGFKADDQPLIQLNDLGGGGGGAGKNFDPKQAFERMDKNKDGKLTLAEAPEQVRPRLEKMFTFLGKTELTEDEYVKAVNQFRKNAPNGPQNPGGTPNGAGKGTGPGRPNADEMFARFDTNKDGKLTLSEAPERLRPMLEKMLERTGKGKDDGISKEEVNRFLAMMQRPDAPAGTPAGEAGQKGADFRAKIFKQQDTDGDGKISKSEASGRIKENFDKLDANGDGNIDAEEFKNVPRGIGEGQKKKKKDA